jgi:hypothetical protein
MSTRSPRFRSSSSRQNVAGRCNTHMASKEAQGVGPNECLASASAGSGANHLIQNRHDYRKTAAESSLLAPGEATNSELGRQRPETTLDSAGEGRRIGDMTAYSPEQIVSRASAAGRAAYAAVIRAGRAVSLAELAYNRAYIRTIPPCWAALLAPPRPPRLDS